MKLGPATNFFFYGTLLDADIRHRVIGRPVGDETLTPASLAGYRRVRVTGKWFPMLVPGQVGDVVDGAIASGFGSAEVARLVAYEGADYGLDAVTLRLADGASARGLVFVPRPGALKPSNEAWNLAAWQRDEKPRVMRGPLV
ncbi:MAG: gamma-glutamylcyclotransferase [Alphaproteobacteria bacterium]|nr:gamma-glutamylcyclotransferase [Alphaproteobacteria bacterium]